MHKTPKEENILRLVNDVQKIIPKVKDIVDAKIIEFKQNMSDDENIFKELCFCILTANFNAEKSVKIQQEIDDGFITLNEKELSKKLSEMGHRYPNTRAKYIVYNRQWLKGLKERITMFKSTSLLREFIVKNIKGVGYKESSHFLRNIGFFDVAIIDYHIIDLLLRYNIIENKPKLSSKKQYLEIENILRIISQKLSLPLGVLDLYLWYMETGKIVK